MHILASAPRIKPRIDYTVCVILHKIFIGITLFDAVVKYYKYYDVSFGGIVISLKRKKPKIIAMTLGARFKRPLSY